MTDSSRRLKVGLFLPAGELFYMGGTPRWDDIAAMARDAEGAGFDSVWIMDHLLIESDTPGWEGVEHGAWECWSILAAIAASTSCIELGPFVSNTLLRNPALTAKMADPSMTKEKIEAERHRLGLDQPAPMQYGIWAANFAKGDMGESFRYNAPVKSLIGQRLGNTLMLGVASLLVTWLLAIPLGIYAAVRKYSMADKVASVVTFTALGIPEFFLALLLLFFAARTGWL